MNYKKIVALKKDPGRVRLTARHLLEVLQENSSENTRKKLASLAEREENAAYSTEEIEALLYIKDHSQKRATVGKARSYTAWKLVKSAYERSVDLEDGDENIAWLEGLLNSGEGLALYDHEWRRLIKVCKLPEIDLISPHEWVDL